MPIMHNTNLPTLEIRHSKEKGRGVFTSGKINAGSPVLAFHGTVRPSHEIPFEDTTHCLEIADGWYLTSSGHMDDYVNHSCEPNCGLSFKGNMNSHEIVLFALKDIEPGTELSFDYSTCLSGRFDPFPCACGSTGCRQFIGAFKDLPPDVQRKYLDLDIVAPYLRPSAGT
jgi:SET domain-containing protein